MVTITCCRTGVHPHLNLGHKGKFTKCFADLNLLAKFIHKSRNSLFYPNIRNELTKEQLKSVHHKLGALWRNDPTKIK